jgi:hypothetical protein
MMTLAGVAMLVAAIGLLWAFRPTPGQNVARAEWIEISVAITVTTGIAVGLMLPIGEIGALLLSQR